MVKNDKGALLAHLILHGKDKSWDELATQFGITSGEVARQFWKKHRHAKGDIPQHLKDYPILKTPLQQTTEEITARVESFSENVEDNTAEITCKTYTEIKSLDDLIKKTKIDTEKWVVTKYVQNYWGNKNDPHWQVKAWLSAKPKESKFKDEFLTFLKSYKPSPRSRNKVLGTDRWVCMIINKQDAHLNKYDIKGDNSIDSRFSKIERFIGDTLEKAEKVGSIEKIIYILGSDQFNSEWTNLTTKGTPQTNILTYEESFEKICNHEVSVIDMLLESCNELEILYIPGNHDAYVGWHMVNWLKAYYKKDNDVKINDHPSNTKYVKYHNTAMMFNHGDAAKPQKLAGIFPMEFKQWSECNFYYLFTGDKHVEQINDFNGIKHYQIPALSKAVSNWDSKNGYTTSKAELTTFLIDRQYGMTDIFKKNI